MPAAPHILAVPNDDGFGPSALLSYVVKAVLRAEPRARVTIWNDFAYDFNRSLYGGERRVRVERVWNLIQLVREDGVVSRAGSLKRMSGYARASRGYGGDGEFDLVLDFGAPAAAWARRRRVPSVTVFDHAWSKSLEMIGGDRPGQRWPRLVSEVEADERQCQRVHLFPDLIASGVFREHWSKLVGPSKVGGGVEGVLRDPAPWSRRRAREFLGLSRPGKTVLVQGGGTPVWDGPLRRLLGQLLEPAGRRRLARLALNLVVWFPGKLIGDDEARALGRLARVRRLQPPPGGTIQKILPAIDSLTMRAGGGSVNDAIAHRKPFVCIREPAQRQIEAILGACTKRGLSWPVDVAEFGADPLGVIVAQHAEMEKRRAAVVRRMRAIPNDAADGLARQILSGVR